MTRLASTGAKSRRHHVVPLAHLTNFAEDRAHPQIVAYDKVAQRYIGPTNPINLAVLRDYNTTDLGGGPTDIIERLLGQFDACGAPVMARLIAEPGPRFSLGTGDRVDLARYVACLNLRVPGFRDAYQEKVNQLVTKAGLAWADVEAKEFRNEKRRKHARRAAKAIREGRMVPGLGNVGPIGLKGIEGLARQIAGMSWLLLDNSGTAGFIIGDNPAAILASNRAVDILDPSIEIALPLSPKRLLLISHSGPDGVVVRAGPAAGPAAAAKMDTMLTPAYGVSTWRTATRHVFGADLDDLKAVADCLTEAERNEVGLSVVVPSGRIGPTGTWIPAGTFPDPAAQIRNHVPRSAFKVVGRRKPPRR